MEFGISILVMLILRSKESDPGKGFFYFLIFTFDLILSFQ